MNIFDEPAFEAAVAQLSSPASRADAIAYRLKKTATEKMEEDPAFYRKFSQLIEDTIAQYQQGRLTELDYLQQVEAARELAGIRAERCAAAPACRHARRPAYTVCCWSLRHMSRRLRSDIPTLADLAIEFETGINR